MKFYVSRQEYWGVEPEEGTVVEIAVGGRDYANPDQLCDKWSRLGEGKEFSDPREAVSAAIAVLEQWKKTEPNAKLAYGNTGGNTLPFEASENEQAEKWAEELYTKLPKCWECGDLLDGERYGTETTTCFETGDDRHPYCSEYCAERAWEKECELNEENDNECT